MKPIEEAVLKTLSYFDIFDYPLTAFELWKWFYVGKVDGEFKKINVGDVVKSLRESEYIKQRIESRDGFYYLKGRASIVSTRMDRYRLAERKYHRALRVASFLRFLPFVKMVGVCNTLAYSNSKREADIDLFIVTKRRRVWQTRFWVTGFLKLLNMRPRPGKTQDTICPSFFIDEDHLSVQGLALEKDIYLPYWVAQVVPIYDEGVYESFYRANEWVRFSLPNVLQYVPTFRRSLSQVRWSKLVYSVFFFLIPERVFKGYQLRVMPRRLRELANKDSRVVVQDYMLKFHDNDRRAQFHKQWEERTAHVL